VDVNVSGPLLDGTASAIAAQMIADVTERITRVGHDMVYSFSAEFYAHPTWRWESELGYVVDYTHGRVYDTVIYTAWLEGVGSRNATTRFKGYHMWQQSAVWLQQSAGEIGSAVVSWWLPRLGGTDPMRPIPQQPRYTGGRHQDVDPGWVPWEHSRFDRD
jgi:hypothetical protein